MMWSTLIIYTGFGLLTFYVHGFIPEIVYAIKKNQLIDGIFRPVSVNAIGESNRATVFQGRNMTDNSDVAMKFCRFWQKSFREYEMYSYLNAINNTEVEKYGISPVFYFKKLAHTFITVFSLFECNLWKKRFTLKVKFEEIDYLILFRDFVRQSKYVHSCGIRHDAIEPHNIMLKKSRSFLIDFDASSKMNDFFITPSIEYASRRFHQQIDNEDRSKIPNGLPLDDWESFLYTMAKISDVKLTWFDVLRKHPGRVRVMTNDGLKVQYTEIRRQKENTNGTIENIKDRFGDRVEFQHLKEIMVAFAKEAFREDVRLPRYNYFDELITEKIHDINKSDDQPAVFTWLKGDEREKAIKDLVDNPPFTAEKIDEPKAEFEANVYEEPDGECFKKLREEMVKNAKDYHDRFLLKQQEKREEDEKKKIESSKSEPGQRACVESENENN